MLNNWPLIKDIAKSVQEGELSALSLVEDSLKKIEDNTQYNSIISVNKKEALERARLIDEEIAKGNNPGRLAGVPFIAKDNFVSFGSNSTAGSNMLKNFSSPYQATAINKLEEEGAILVAKANLDAFAHGSSTENSAFGPSLNPHDTTRVPGGSSGGSAVAVVLGLVPFALGTDTGGSIRLPASFCGAVGFKPTYGLISRYGVVAMASSTDVIGPLTNNVDDAALIVDVLAGRDFFDGTTIDRQPDDYSDLTGSIKGKKIGILKEYFSDGLDKDVKELIQKNIKKLSEAGAQVEEVSIPSLNLALACYYIIVPAEISSNLSRYDGQKYGYSEPKANDLEEVYERSRDFGFSDENKRRIMIGCYVLSSGYYDAYYKKAQTVRTKLINEFNDVFKKVDYLIGPTAPTTAFKIGQNIDDPLQMYLADIMTVAANLVGIPSISLPAGQIDGLPVGIQIMSKQRHDKQLLDLSKAFEGLR